MSEKTTINDLLNELQQTVKARGASATATLLRNARETVSENTHMQFVVITVCNQISISIDQMMNEKNDKAKYAKGFVVHYLRKDFLIPWPAIKLLLDHKDQSWLWQLMKLVKGLKPKLSTDAAWLVVRTALDKQIKDYKTQIK